MFETSRLERVGYAARRSVVMARQGMVVSSQPLAVEAGVGILKKGGNAIDAAIATALTLGVVEPVSTGIGGGCLSPLSVDGGWPHIRGQR